MTAPVHVVVGDPMGYWRCGHCHTTIRDLGPDNPNTTPYVRSMEEWLKSPDNCDVTLPGRVWLYKHLVRSDTPGDGNDRIEPVEIPYYDMKRIVDAAYWWMEESSASNVARADFQRLMPIFEHFGVVPK